MKRLKKMKKKNEENDKGRVGEECRGRRYWGMGLGWGGGVLRSVWLNSSLSLFCLGWDVCLAICPWSRQRGKCVERCSLTFLPPQQHCSQIVPELLQCFHPVPPICSSWNGNMKANITHLIKSYGTLKLCMFCQITPDTFCCVGDNPEKLIQLMIKPCVLLRSASHVESQRPHCYMCRNKNNGNLSIYFHFLQLFFWQHFTLQPTGLANLMTGTDTEFTLLFSQIRKCFFSYTLYRQIYIPFVCQKIFQRQQ